MAQEWAVAFYHSPAWRRNRNNYMQRTLDTPFGLIPPMMCERCYEMGKLKPAKVDLPVHRRVDAVREIRPVKNLN